MRLFPFSLIVAAVALYISINHLGQQVMTYFDFVAFVMVFGGTLAVAIVTFPWEYRRDLLQAFKLLFAKEHARYREVIQTCLLLVNKGAKEIPNLQLNRDSIYKRLLLDGSDMLELAFSQERLEQILREKLFQSAKRFRRIANAMRSLAKYPPAFGLTGTVLGLVNIMRGLNNGLDAKRTALEMSLALVATFYGLLVANLLINPAGELVLKKAQEEEELGEIALQTLLMLNKDASPLEAQEVLNALVPEEHRLDVTDAAFEEAA